MLMLLAAPVLFAQDTLGYRSFIRNIREYHPVSGVARNIGRSGELMYQSARGGYDPMISGGYTQKFFDNKNYYSLLGANLKQPLFTSQYLTAGYDLSQGAYVNPENKTPLSGIPFIGVETAVLQGLMFDKRRAGVLKARSYKGYYEAEQNVMMNDLLYSASTYYFEWVYAARELSLYRYFSELAEQRFNAIVALSVAGEAAAVDSIEASILFQGRYLDMQSVSIEYQKNTAGMFTYNWVGQDRPAGAYVQLAPADSLEVYYERVKKTLALYLNDTVNNNPALQKYRSYQGVLEVEQKYRQELIKPRLDVKYNFLSNSPVAGDLSFNTNNYKWGVTFAMPLFLRTPRNDFKVARLQAQNNRLEWRNKENELDVKSALVRKNLNVVSAQLVNAENNVRYNRMLLEAEKIKFDHGESSLFILNTRETRWMESELKLAQYRFKFISLALELIYLKGELSYDF